MDFGLQPSRLARSSEAGCSGCSSRGPHARQHQRGHHDTRFFVSTVPAELIQTEGPPNLVPIEGTELMQVQNSDNGLFFYESNQRFYVLISGRWFGASSLGYGPWAFIPYKELPKDLTKIPPTHPKANVLASVPGTPQ